MHEGVEGVDNEGDDAQPDTHGAPTHERVGRLGSFQGEGSELDGAVDGEACGQSGHTENRITWENTASSMRTEKGHHWWEASKQGGRESNAMVTAPPPVDELDRHPSDMPGMITLASDCLWE